MFDMYEVVRLKNQNASVPLPKGSRGTILIIHRRNPPAYEVEFVSDSGTSLGVYTVDDKLLEKDDPKTSKAN
jgi:hypothetical protein